MARNGPIGAAVKMDQGLGAPVDDVATKAERWIDMMAREAAAAGVSSPEKRRGFREVIETGEAIIANLYDIGSELHQVADALAGPEPATGQTADLNGPDGVVSTLIRQQYTQEHAINRIRDAMKRLMAVL